jgi:hypothetical protein
VNLNKYIKKQQNNRDKDKDSVIILTIHITHNQLIVSYEKKPKNRLMAILGHECERNFIFVSFELYET